MWIDTHCHLDAAEWTDEARQNQRALARAAGVILCVYPAVEQANWAAVQALAHQTGDAYALGIHPLYVPEATDADLAALEAALHDARDDPRLVAVGEIGLDFFVPELCEPEMQARQWQFYTAQLALAHRFGLPVILHVRRAVDRVLQGLRVQAAQRRPVPGGIAHAFNGSWQQAQACQALDLRLGVGGAVTYDNARQLRRLVTELPAGAWVMETDAPDIPPQWLYVTAQARAAGHARRLNSPAELPRMGAVVAALRGVAAADWAATTQANACAALPRLSPLLPESLAHA